MKKINRITALLLIAVLLFSGCSKKKTESEVLNSDTYSTDVDKTETAVDTKTDVKVSTSSSKETGSTTTSSDVKTETKPEAESAAGAYELPADSSAFDTSEFYMAEEIAVDETPFFFEVKPGAGEFWDTTPRSDDFVSSKDRLDYGEGIVGDFADDEIGIIDPIYPEEPIIVYDPSDPDYPEDPIEPWEPEPLPTEMPVMPRAGLLTAGEWNDNRNYAFLRELLANGQQENYSRFFTEWDLKPFKRLVVQVMFDDGSPVRNADVSVFGNASDMSGDNCLWKSRTDNEGMAYVYYNVSGTEVMPALVEVTYQDGFTTYELTSADLLDDAVITIDMGGRLNIPKTLDLMLLVDTTGSMSDELRYLQVELEDVINRVRTDNANIPVRLSVNFYRDLEDDYVVRSYPFSSNIDEELGYLRIEYADGGGDYEEAVELALDDAINNHDWEQDSVKLMFMVLDAPPHNTFAIRQSLMASLSEASWKGIRIIPIASSGVDKSTEFLLRAMAMVTGGTYTFLTDDSGIGGGHLEPTVGSYDVEYLNDMMVRIISEYLK